MRTSLSQLLEKRSGWEDDMDKKVPTRPFLRYSRKISNLESSVTGYLVLAKYLTCQTRRWRFLSRAAALFRGWKGPLPD